MTITPKYSIDEAVWIMFQNKPVIMKIDSISTFTNHGRQTTIEYSMVDHSIKYSEEQIFTTKEELLQSL